MRAGNTLDAFPAETVTILGVCDGPSLDAPMPERDDELSFP
jgi:hypothetical protein